MTGTRQRSGDWGPTIAGGNRVGLRRAIKIVGVVGLVLLLVVAGIGIALYRVLDANLNRIDVTELASQSAGQPLNVLVVGSDSRGNLTDEQIDALHLGSFAGQRSDTVMIVSVSPLRDSATVVSLPRDLLVIDRGKRRKLTETFSDGPDNLVSVVQNATGVPIHHYIEVSVPGFMSVVEVLGSVHLCLDDALYDSKSGAAFTAGCHDMTPTQALAYVRSRRGERSDFERIERQQRFLQAAMQRLVELRMLVDVPRLFRTVEQVAKNVTTDGKLGVNQMRTLASELRDISTGNVPMTFVPSYAETIDGKSYVVAYQPGAARLFDALREGRSIADRGHEDDRADVRVAVWNAGDRATGSVVLSTLFWSGFEPIASGPGRIEGLGATTVFWLPGHEAQAGWVAATLGAALKPFPTTETPPRDVGVTVVIGSADAA